MRYAKLGFAAKTYVDPLTADQFGVSFELERTPPLTVVLDRATLARLQVQIASALKLQQQPAAD